MRRFFTTSIPKLKKSETRYKIQRKVMKQKDRYAIWRTGEKPLHPWLNKTRALAILAEKERLRNMNRYTIKY